MFVRDDVCRMPVSPFSAGFILRCDSKLVIEVLVVVEYFKLQGTYVNVYLHETSMQYFENA